MIAVIAEINIRAGADTDFEALVRKIRQEEAGTLLYRLARSLAEKTKYRFIEFYADNQALQAHSESEYFKQALAAMGNLLSAPPKIEYLDVVH